ncbi:MAG TPA: phosphoribosylamine--glycine ligase [Actinomycetota bacterium]|nr:phosphoribosylamine--glycine ligase [Actinomycetota bacterium]
MRVLVVGGGGREHAICWALAQNPMVDRLYAAPGNAGIAAEATPVSIGADAVDALAAFVEGESIDLTVVGPEAPLVAGLADELTARGLPVFGPTRDGARLEGSKAWARDLCERYGIPSAHSRTFEELGPAQRYLEQLDPPYVIKADGLAAGKGVTVTDDRAEALRALEECLVHGAFGDAGRTVLVEEYLEGVEVSAMALTDGRTVAPLALAHDYKRALDEDQGPNTGGMGAHSPLPFVDAETEQRIADDVLHLAAEALAREGIRYRGVIYAGLMLTAEGPKVLEFNCRFGDPETQVVLPRLSSSLGELLLACVEGNLGDYRLVWTEAACVGVVATSGGYPGSYQTGTAIAGLEDAARMEGVNVFHSGTALRDGRVVTAGGRVLTVTALGPTLEEARARAYAALDRISFDGMQHRKGIAAPLPQGVGRHGGG